MWVFAGFSTGFTRMSEPCSKYRKTGQLIKNREQQQLLYFRWVTYSPGGSFHALPYTLVRASLQLMLLIIHWSSPPACSVLLSHKQYYQYTETVCSVIIFKPTMAVLKSTITILVWHWKAWMEQNEQYVHADCRQQFTAVIIKHFKWVNYNLQVNYYDKVLVPPCL